MRSVIAAAILFGLLGCDREPDLPSAEKKALYDAVGSGDMELLKRALAAGVSPNLYQSERGYLIHQATAVGNREAMRLLIDAGADVNAVKDGGYAPLLVAALGEDCEASRLLLAAGADPKRRLKGAEKAALDPAYEDKTAWEIHQLNMQKIHGLSEQGQSCWRDVEPLLAKPG
jgi:ankyrin repeat protein